MREPVSLIPLPPAITRQFVRSFAAIAMVCLAAIGAEAQLGSSFPPLAYYSAKGTFRSGDFRRGLEAFETVSRMGLRFGNNRWADSICYHTMRGECFYHLGEFPRALEQYNLALRIFGQNQGWLRRVEFPDAVATSQSRIRQTILWGERKTVMGDFRRMQVLFGDGNVQRVLQEGGAFARPEIRAVDVAEIVRCTALALQRRAELLGPVGPTDPLSSQILSTFDGRIGRPNHWSQAWTDVQRGFALLGMNKIGEASDAFKRSILIAGKFDHPLTGMALFELGRLAEKEANYGRASDHYLQASLAAAQYEQATLVEQALHRLSVVHMLSGGRGVPPGLEAAAAWAKRNRFGQLYCSIMADVAEHLAVSGDSSAAQAAIVQARKIAGRRNRISAQVTARLAMQTALVQYQQGRAEKALDALNDAAAVRRTCSPWLFQLTLVNALYETNADELSDRETTLLYEELLREPTTTDWVNDTLDTMAVLSARKDNAFQYWFDVSIRRAEEGRAIEIAERYKRHKFFSELPLGGRNLALRWMLEAPEELLDDATLERRQDIQTRYPRLSQLSVEVERHRRKLRESQIDEDDPDSYKTQLEVAKLLHKATNDHEVLLGEIALRREDSPYSFPPLLSLEQIQKRLAPNQLVISFFVADRSGYVMMVGANDHAVWKIPQLARTRKGVAALLREMGMTGDASSLSLSTLENEKWKSTSSALVDEIFEIKQHGFWRKFDELLIVPDGFLWYLPFEALIVANKDQEEVPMIATSQIRYAPTIALGLSGERKQRREPRSVAVLGQLFPRDKTELAREQLTEIQNVVEGFEALAPKVAAPSGLLRSTWDRLVVFDDLKNTKRTALEWAPAGFDQERPQTSLRRWMSLPWGGPLEVYLPGFHTAAENGLRKNADGQEIFMALTGLMASGTRTVILSRWRTGGQTSYDLMREYLQEAPFAKPSEAWQRSVQILRDSELNPAWEPRISAPSSYEKMITADHPFFWSGYILSDRGVRAAEQPPQEGGEKEMRKPDAEPSEPEA